MIRPAFKCYGGKFYLSRWIISLFPSDSAKYTYVEPFGGGVNVLLNKDRSEREVISDIDLNVVQIYRAIRDEPGPFAERLEKITYSQETFDEALARDGGPFDDYLDHAVNEFILRRMSRSGLRKNFAWSSRLRGGVPGDLNAWRTALKALPAVAERVKKVNIFHKPAAEVITTFDGPDTLVYADPPYLRGSADEKDHAALAAVLKKFKGRVLISGQPSDFYTELYKGWKCECHASQRKFRTECVFKNF